MINIPSTSWLTVTVTLSTRQSRHMSRSTLCEYLPTVDQVSTNYQPECPSSTDWNVNQGYWLVLDQDTFSRHLSHGKLVQYKGDFPVWYKLIGGNNCMTTHLVSINFFFKMLHTSRENKFLYADFKIVWMKCTKGICLKSPLIPLIWLLHLGWHLIQHSINISIDSWSTLHWLSVRQLVDSRLIFTDTWRVTQ